MKTVEEDFLWALKTITQVKMPAKAVFREVWNRRKEFHPSGEFLCFGEDKCPWKENLHAIEEELEEHGLIKFVFAKDDRGMDRIMAVPPSPGSFAMRVPLCKDWRGLRNEGL
jgi:uncharacterized UPF0160 family protein